MSGLGAPTVLRTLMFRVRYVQADQVFDNDSSVDGLLALTLVSYQKQARQQQGSRVCIHTARTCPSAIASASLPPRSSVCPELASLQRKADKIPGFNARGSSQEHAAVCSGTLKGDPPPPATGSRPPTTSEPPQNAGAGLNEEIQAAIAGMMADMASTAAPNNHLTVTAPVGRGAHGELDRLWRPQPLAA